jgi:hypothetical protein
VALGGVISGSVLDDEGHSGGHDHVVGAPVHAGQVRAVESGDPAGARLRTIGAAVPALPPAGLAPGVDLVVTGQRDGRMVASPEVDDWSGVSWFPVKKLSTWLRWLRPQA